MPQGRGWVCFRAVGLLRAVFFLTGVVRGVLPSVAIGKLWWPWGGEGRDGASLGGAGEGMVGQGGAVRA